MAFFLTTWSTVGWSCIITLYRFRHLFPIVMGGSLCSANDTQPSFIFEKCQKNVLAHDRIDVIIYVKVPFHSLSLLSFFLSTHPQFLWARVVWHDLESIGAIKRKWFGRKGNRITGFMDETDMPTHFFFYSSLHKTLLRLTKNSFVHFK